MRFMVELGSPLVLLGLARWNKLDLGSLEDKP
jgi:hypothetical protein